MKIPLQAARIIVEHETNFNRKQAKQDFEAAKEAAKGDSDAMKWLKDHQHLWFQNGQRP